MSKDFNQKRSIYRKNIQKYIKNGIKDTKKLENLYLEASFYGILGEFPDLWGNIEFNNVPNKVNKKGFKSKLSKKPTVNIGPREKKRESAFNTNPVWGW